MADNNNPPDHCENVGDTCTRNLETVEAIPRPEVEGVNSQEVPPTHEASVSEDIDSLPKPEVKMGEALEEPLTPEVGVPDIQSIASDNALELTEEEEALWAYQKHVRPRRRITEKSITEFWDPFMDNLNLGIITQEEKVLLAHVHFVETEWKQQDDLDVAAVDAMYHWEWLNWFLVQVGKHISELTLQLEETYFLEKVEKYKSDLITSKLNSLCPSLKALSFSGMGSIAYAPEGEPVPTMKMLSIHMESTQYVLGRPVLLGYANIKKLSLSEKLLSMTWITSTTKCPSIKILCISDIGYETGDLQELANYLKPFPNMQALELRGTNITTMYNMEKLISKIQTMTPLKRILIDGTISTCGNPPEEEKANLEELVLDYTCSRGVMFAVLVPFGRVQKVKMRLCTELHGVVPDGLEALVRKFLPGAEEVTFEMRDRFYEFVL